MARGGRRAGAGRKPGSLSRRTREIAERASQGGITPLEYLLSVLRSEIPPELAEQIKTGNLDGAAIKAIVGWEQVRMEAAKAAAPYVHPRLAQIEHGSKEGSPPITFRMVLSGGGGGGSGSE